MREWFSDFEIQAVDVTGNFGPAVMLAFLSANLLEAARLAGLSQKEQMQFSGTTIGEWAEFWAGKLGQPPGFQGLQSMPQEVQKRLAAGFELVARKPAAS